MFRSKSSRDKMRQMDKRTEKERLDKLKKKEKNRKRPNTIAFRMSDEKRRLFEDRVAMSGFETVFSRIELSALIYPVSLEKNCEKFLPFSVVTQRT